MLKTVERVPGRPAVGHVLDLFAEHLHLGGEAAHRLVRGDMRGHVAQRGDGVLELVQRRRVFLRDDEIDLVGEAVDRLVEADQVFRRCQAAQRVAHFGQAVLDARDRPAVDAGLAAFGDALGQALDLLLDGVDGATRHRVVERAADFAKLAAQRVDRFFDARFAQRLDLIGDAAELVFQARQILRRHRHQHGRQRLLRRRHRHLGRPLRRQGRLCGQLPRLRRGAVERALARADFGDGAVERRLHRRRLRHRLRRIGLRRRHRGRHMRHHRLRHGLRGADELVDAPVKPADQLGELVGVVAAALGRIGRRSRA